MKHLRFSSQIQFQEPPRGGEGGGSLQAAFKFVPPQSEALRFQAEPHRESLRACNLRATSDFMEKRTCRIIGT